MADLALPPSSTHFSEHLRVALGLRQDFYTFDLAMWDSESETRVFRPFPMHLPHECWAEEYVRHPESFDTSVSRDLLPPALETHPVTVMNGTECTVPVGLYSDGVPHTNSRVSKAPLALDPCKKSSEFLIRRAARMAKNTHEHQTNEI